MSDEWLILHGGALGDLALTIQLALRLPGVDKSGVLRVISRTDPGDLSACRPSIVQQSSEGLGLHWLFGDHDDPPPERLRDVLSGARVLSALGGVHMVVHHRLAELGPVAVYSIDPRPRDGVQRHITDQWQTQIEGQGLLVPKCIHQHPAQRGLGVPAELRQHGHELMRALACASRSDPRGDAAVVIHPGSGGRRKCWPLRCFAQVAHLLRDDHAGAAVSFLVGPVELETWPASELTDLARDFPVIRCPTPDELAAILAAARVLVGNDAGPAHLAALLGTPTVTVFGPTSSDIWRPLGTGAQTAEGDPQAANWGIRPEDVASLVRKRL